MNDNNIKKNISIALCTRNGSAFIEDQLQSISAQSLKPAELVISDDASTDATVELIHQWTGGEKMPLRLLQNQEPLGVVGNYEQAINYCRGDYIALCDQDDLWLPPKLELSLEAMQKVEQSFGAARPILVYTDLSVVDLKGEIIAPSFMTYQGLEHVDQEPLKRLLAHNFVTGSTILINRPLLEAALPLPEAAILHDWWLALAAAALGKIIFIARPTVLYRQHDLNLVGSKGYYWSGNVRRIRNINLLEARIAATIKQGLALKERLMALPGAEIPVYLEQYLDAASKNGIRALLVARRNGIGQPGLLRNAVFNLLLAKGRYRAGIEEQ